MFYYFMIKVLQQLRYAQVLRVSSYRSILSRNPRVPHDFILIITIKRRWTMRTTSQPCSLSAILSRFDFSSSPWIRLTVNKITLAIPAKREIHSATQPRIFSFDKMIFKKSNYLKNSIASTLTLFVENNFICSFVRSFLPSFVHSFIRSSVHPFVTIFEHVLHRTLYCHQAK